MSKLKNILIIALLIIAVGLFFYGKMVISDLNDKLDTAEDEKKEELQKVRDSAFTVIDNNIEKSNRKIDSVLSLKDKIKYITYEKYYYTDRDLDSALDTIADYRYNP